MFNVKLDSILKSVEQSYGEHLEIEAAIQLLRRAFLNWDFKTALKLVLVLKRSVYKRSTILYQVKLL